LFAVREPDAHALKEPVVNGIGVGSCSSAAAPSLLALTGPFSERGLDEAFSLAACLIILFKRF
jgi:hypothetical protein